MRERLKTIREAASALAEPAPAKKRKALPGLVASLRHARAQGAADDAPGQKLNRATSTEKIALVAITRHGLALAGRVVAALPGARLFAPEKFAETAERAAPGKTSLYAGKTGDALGGLFAEYDAIVAIVSLGAMIRLMAPYLKSKESDPAVIVLDEAGKFVIPALSGHLGGANALAGRLAKALGATPVLTTASDARETLAVDLLGRELGWTLEATHEALVNASAAVVNDAPVALVQEAGSPDWWANHANGRTGVLPANLTLFERIEELDPARFAAVLWISQRELPGQYADALAGRCVVYRPAKSP